ncbi:DUF192 domain-containing protein [Halocatena halophila]|uniref:DUF192 domain-containing protein n=1 Tax=Halocatena halophila TaxID=2814576 RepID=UPI002ECFEF92
MQRQGLRVLGAIVTIAAIIIALGAMGYVSVPYITPQTGDYDTTTVTITNTTASEPPHVEARIADTRQKRYVGLSDTDQLGPDEGMLFTYDQEQNHTYVMRKMDFGIDIVYIGADNRINTIHHAPKPDPGVDGNTLEYPGRGKYVLEVPYNWTTRNGVSTGDRVQIDGNV